MVGLAGRFPGARDVEEFWRNLEAGVDSISHFAEDEIELSRLEAPGMRTSPGYVRARGVLPDADKFDASFFGITPREAAVMDPQQRLFLEGAWEALESAGYDPATYPGSIGVWAGAGLNTYFLENVVPRWDVVEGLGLQQAVYANERDYLTTRVSYKLNLRGPSISVATSCSTSLVAVCQAVHALLSFQCDMALAGGVFVNPPFRRGYLHQEGAMLSGDGRCRPFDAGASGTVFSDGLGIVVLKRLPDAVADGDDVVAVIRGAALNNDGSAKVSYTAPSVDGQAEVVAMAHAFAGVDPETISYVEAHGTATPLGDPVEIAALTQAFRAGTQATGFCAIGSVKGNVGHLDAAAGVAGLIKTALALKRRRLPASLHFTRPNPQIAFEETPFYVNHAPREWPSGPAPRRAGVSCFGIGGTNAHVVLEEAPVVDSAPASRREQLLLLSARSPAALDEATTRLQRRLEQHPEAELADVAWTLQAGRRAFPFRRALVSVAAREAASDLGTLDRKRVRSGSAERTAVDVAFLLPGQGAQYAGMAMGLYRSEPAFAEELDACAACLEPQLGLDIRTLLHPEPAGREDAGRRLAETAMTQPALFAVESALARLWMTWGIEPAAMIGHSLGEYVAAYLAGTLTREDAATLVAARARLMQEQPSGAMLAVRRPAADLEGRLGGQTCIAALNSPKLTVASGPEAEIAELEARLGADGVACRRLATSHAFHSPSMDGALAPFRRVLESVRLAPPRVPWVSCLTGDWIAPREAVDPDYWVRQLREPVRFSDGMRVLARDPGRVLLEVGPGRTLGALVLQHRERPVGQAVVSSLGGDADSGGDVRTMLDALGQLWIAGVTPDWRAVHGGEARRRVSLPTYPFERKRHWIDPPALAEGAARTLAEPAVVRVAADAAHAPDDAAGSESNAAADGVEGRLRLLLSNASGIPASEIDASQSFLELGFDSLLLAQVSAAIERTFGVAVAFRALMEDLSRPADLVGHLTTREAAAATSSATASEAPIAARETPSRPEAEAPSDATAAAVPLTEAQREIWAVLWMGPEASCSYNLCFALRLSGDVSADLLRRAVGQMFDRHEALRMRFDASGEWQRPGPRGSCDVPLVDLSRLTQGEREARVESILQAEGETPFDLVAGPPARAQIVVEAPGRHLLVLTGHHIVLDGWSAWVCFQELATIYGALARDEMPSLPPAEPFGRFVERQSGQDVSAARAAALDHWRARLVGAAPFLDLPVDHPRPALKTFRGALEVRGFGPELTAGIKRAAARLGSTNVGFLLGGLHALLHRLAAQPDVIVGLPMSVRGPGDRASVGHATNLLPIRAQIDGQTPFATHLRAVTKSLLDAQEHQSLSFGSLVHQLGLPRDPSRNPLVSVMFNVDRGRFPAPAFSGVQAEIRVPARRHLNFEIEMNVVDLGTRFVLECTYNADLFEATTLKRWLAHYEALLTDAVADPQTPVQALRLLTDEEWERLRRWNATEAELPEACLPELFSAQAARTPDRVTVVFEGRTLTYHQLDEMSERLARRLRARELGPGSRVGVYMERSAEMLVALLGVLKAGCAYVPLDPAFPPERLSYMVEDSRAAVLVTHAAVAAALPTRDVPALRIEDEEDAAPVVAGATGPGPVDPAYVIYTSGSTGTPKGVAIAHRSLVNLLLSMGREPGLSPDDVLLSVTTLSFDIAALELYLPLIRGARVVLAGREEAADGRRLGELLASSGATVMQATPATWRLLLEAGWDGAPGLKVLCGGEALPRDLADLLLGRVGELWNVYGPTETTVWSSAWRVESEGPVSIGRPIANTRMYVLDSGLAPVPVGVSGELYIGGAGVALGYWQRPELTAERFVPDPFSDEPGARLYRSGDLARWREDGTLECLGRADLQVKVRGFRIELGEIEAALRRNPGVEDAVAIAEHTPSGDNRLVAYITHGSGIAPTVTDLRNFLRTSLPDYMVPSAYSVVDALPLTPNGKVDRKQLQATLAAPLHRAESRVAPRSPMERLVAESWGEALGIEAVSVTDNFFDLGGHSLMAARVLARLEPHAGRRISPREIVVQTLEQFAAGLEASAAASAEAPPAPQPFVSRVLGAARRLFRGSPAPSR